MRSRVIVVLFLVVGVPLVCRAQAAPPDVPTSHVTVTANFSGFNSGGRMQAATVDAFGVQLTEYLSAGYVHVQIPSLATRYELGVVNYNFTLPKLKQLLFDSSNFVVTLQGGAGKYLSPAGNHWAEIVGASLTYPIAGHMGWQVVNYQYIHSPVSGVLNKSYQSASTGPILYF